MANKSVSNTAGTNRSFIDRMGRTEVYRPDPRHCNVYLLLCNEPGIQKIYNSGQYP